MSPRRQLGLLALATAALMAVALRCGAQTTKADTTVCVSFRTITTTTGTVRSTSVGKVACGSGTPAKPDTIRITRVDTVRVQLPGGAPSPVAEDPRGWNCWIVGNAFGINGECVGDEKTVEAYSSNQTLIAGGHTFGRVRYMRNGIISATDPTPSAPPPVVTPPVVVVPPPVVVVPPPVVTPPSGGGVTTVQEAPTRIGVFRGAERIGQVAPTGNISVLPWTQWAAWRKTGPGTLCMNDAGYPSSDAALAAVTAPYTGRDLCAPPANPPELPRHMAEMDSLVASARAADTLPRTRVRAAPARPRAAAPAKKKAPAPPRKEPVG